MGRAQAPNLLLALLGALVAQAASRRQLQDAYLEYADSATVGEQWLRFQITASYSGATAIQLRYLAPETVTLQVTENGDPQNDWMLPASEDWNTSLYSVHLSQGINILRLTASDADFTGLLIDALKVHEQWYQAEDSWYSGPHLAGALLPALAGNDTHGGVSVAAGKTGGNMVVAGTDGSEYLHSEPIGQAAPAKEQSSEQLFGTYHPGSPTSGASGLSAVHIVIIVGSCSTFILLVVGVAFGSWLTKMKRKNQQNNPDTLFTHANPLTGMRRTAEEHPELSGNSSTECKSSSYIQGTAGQVVVTTPRHLSEAKEDSGQVCEARVIAV